MNIREFCAAWSRSCCLRLRPDDLQEVAHLVEIGDAVLEVDARHRPALRLVGVEEVRAGLVAEHRGELPGEIVRVLHAGIEAEPAGRREAVRGIAGEEEAALPVARRPPPRRATMA